jgi:hypothetical protein
MKVSNLDFKNIHYIENKVSEQMRYDIQRTKFLIGNNFVPDYLVKLADLDSLDKANVLSSELFSISLELKTEDELHDLISWYSQFIIEIIRVKACLEYVQTKIDIEETYLPNKKFMVKMEDLLRFKKSEISLKLKRYKQLDFALYYADKLMSVFKQMKK